jgi:hypothetical protein
MIENCWKEGGGKARQGPRQRAKAKKNQEGTRPPKEVKTTTIEEVTNQEASAHAFTALPIANDRAPIRKKSYIFDSGARDHISPYKNDFISFESIKPCPIAAANNHKISAIGKGTMVIKIPNGSRITTLYLRDVLYSPEISFTLVSLSRADKAGYSTLIKGGMMNIVDRTQKKTIGQISSVQGIWQIEDRSSTIDSAAFTAMSLTDLHRSLAHVAPVALQKLVQGGKIRGIELSDTSESFARLVPRAKSSEIHS